MDEEEEDVIEEEEDESDLSIADHSLSDDDSEFILGNDEGSYSINEASNASNGG